MSKRTSVVLDESAETAIETMVRESFKSDEIPDMSQSEIIRQLLAAGLENSDLSDLVPEHEQVALKRDQVKEQNKLRDWRAGFRTRVKREFTKRFRNGYDPDQLAQVAVGFREEARVLWHDDDDPEHSRKRREGIDYVDQVIAEARRAHDQSEHDPLDPEAVFASFGGVEAGEQAERVEGIDLDQKAREIIRDRRAQGFSDPDLGAIATKLSNEHGVDESVARTVVSEVSEGISNE